MFRLKIIIFIVKMSFLFCFYSHLFLLVYFYFNMFHFFLCIWSVRCFFFNHSCFNIFWVESFFFHFFKQTKKLFDFFQKIFFEALTIWFSWFQVWFPYILFYSYEKSEKTTKWQALRFCGKEEKKHQYTNWTFWRIGIRVTAQQYKTKTQN